MFVSRFNPDTALSTAFLVVVASLILMVAPTAKADRSDVYCPLSVGYSVSTLPRGHRSILHGGSRYYSHGGHFYQPQGSGFIVVAAPLGYRSSALSHGHDSFFYGNYRYSTFHNDYYRWYPRSGVYISVERPYQSRHQHSGPQIFASSGQSGGQRKQDTTECQQLAADETGYDARRGGSRTYEYEPIFRGCLERRGYTVR